MLSEKTNFIGIDLSGGFHPFTYASLDEERKLLILATGGVEEILEYLTTQQALVVAINAPPHPNNGLVRKKLEKQNPSPGHLRGVDMRVVEYELRELGISVSPTLSKTENCAAWMQTGFNFYHELERAGFRPYPSESSSHQWLETHPHAAYCTLLGKLPLPKPTLEGRLQRQLAIHEQDIGIKDPMEFFEEITRHRLLNGILPMELVYGPEELDALMAAFIAYQAAMQPADVKWIGDPQEGQIVLPVSELKRTYV
jgi:hypothetical protein